MSEDCIFCKIIAGEIPSKKVYQDERVTAFHDINPVAPVHILIVPNEHIASVNEVELGQEALLGHLFVVARQIAEAQGIAENGYRLIVNTGPHAGQVVFHLHMHLLGGHKMRYPMG
ncbi:MAG TPA: histidine triad nucleotide-binding protein [Anaerolineae bacterium]|nr:histidine triad nucleotide-binding protein [Anaerolineae bacterium]HID84973.1 histidine triad nucleotide-binding protein [Anaerolineales bacterium]HIQ08661.1 histidine triad nucleotide-binding protein [Anaerolineaceae bacterium]